MSSSLLFRSFRATSTRALARPTRQPLAAQSRRWLSTQTQPEAVTFEEPSRAGLFYHLVQQGVGARPAFAVSFLPQPPKSASSPTVVGLLPVPKDGDEATFSDFVPNSRFQRLLERSIQDSLTKGLDESLKVHAKMVHDGWIHVNDERNSAAKTGDRIGDPDDIVGSVCVQDGEIVPSTFAPLPTYRLCTPDGVIQLSDPLMRNLVQTLQAAHDAE